ncbi:MAG: adenylate kinase [bacterium]|jgi:adenylate kinase
MKTIILLGAPGAGKGTIAEGIRNESAFIHVSTGDMLREAVKNGTVVGRQAEGYMKRGELVPDDVIVGIVGERLERGARDLAYMFDGFPRTLDQARLLDETLARYASKVDKVFLLDAPRDLLLARLTGRRVCRKCGQSYHVINIPPKKEGICDLCGGELYQRADDSESTILNRLEVYTKQTESLISYYEKKGVLVRVDSARQRQATVAEILAVAKPLIAS